MDKKQITVKLLNRSFPIAVSPDEEAALLRAVRIIEDKLKDYKMRFNVTDELYMALMCCIDISVEHVNYSAELNDFQTDFLDKMRAINRELETAIRPPIYNS